jgi:hypothetical protein
MQSAAAIPRVSRKHLTYREVIHSTRLIPLGADPAIGVALIQRHQRHNGVCDGIGCGQQHIVGGMHVPTGDAVRLVAEQSDNGRRVIADISSVTGEAMAQHMGCDIGPQITQLANQIAGPRLGGEYSASCARQGK